MKTICPKCKKGKKYKNQSYCLICCRIIGKECYYKNKEKRLAKEHRRYSKKKDTILKQQREYYQQNKKKIRKRQKKYQSKNREDYKKWHKDWRIKNPKKLSFWSGQHQIRKRNAEGSHTFKEWEELKKQYDWTCPRCGKQEPEIKLTQDHIKSLNKGGTNWIKNIQPLCLKCNSFKNDRFTKKYKRKLAQGV